jgi:two-component system OmpR family sensor kinase
MPMRPKLRRTLSDRRKVFALVALLTIAAVAIVETATLRAAHTQLFRRTDTALQKQVESARKAAHVLTPAQMGALIELPDIVTPDTASVVITKTGRVVYTVPVVERGRPSLPVLPSRATLRADLDKPFTVAGTGGVRRFRAIAGGLDNGATIVIAAPLTGVDGTIADLRRQVLWISAAALVLLGLILWRLLAAATKPTNAMIDVAARIGDGDFTARVDPAGLHGDAARLGIALNQMVMRIEHAFAETSASEEKLRRFVADASHELRTPLTSIRGYAQLLRMGAAGDEAETATRRIDSEAARMAALVDDLLLLARLDQGRPLAREPVDVAAIVRDLGDDARMLEPLRPISVDVPDDPIVVLGDESRLRQLLMNLLGNVRRHTEPRAACALQVHPTDTDVLITVSDHGGGMNAVDAAHAFDRFYRADASRNRDSGGSGLGLSIARAIVEAHGGSITLDTAVNAGTRVTIRLPRAHRDLPAPALRPELTPASNE